MKRNAFYIIALLVLGSCWVVLKWLEKSREEAALKKRNELVFTQFDKDDIAQIDLELPGERLRFKKSATDWLQEPEGFAANQVYIEFLEDALLNLSWGEQVSDRVEDHPNYHLDARSKLAVFSDEQGKELARVYVGKPGKNYRTAFFRLGDDPRVFYTVTDLFPSLTRPCWLDRSVWKVPESSLPTITLEWNGNLVEFEKKTKGWISNQQSALDSEFMNSILNLEASMAFPQPPEEKPDIRAGYLKIQTGPVSMTLDLFASSQHILAVRNDCRSPWYQFPPTFLDKLLPE